MNIDLIQEKEIELCEIKSLTWTKFVALKLQCFLTVGVI
jgi:hypothetical protein